VSLSLGPWPWLLFLLLLVVRADRLPALVTAARSPLQRGTLRATAALTRP
jgi:hypothetical protein